MRVLIVLVALAGTLLATAGAAAKPAAATICSYTRSFKGGRLTVGDVERSGVGAVPGASACRIAEYIAASVAADVAASRKVPARLIVKTREFRDGTWVVKADQPRLPESTTWSAARGHQQVSFRVYDSCPGSGGGCILPG